MLNIWKISYCMLTFHHHRCKCAERHTFGQSSSCSSPEGLYKHSEAPAGIWGRCKCTQPWVQAARGGCSSREPYRGIPIDLWRWVKCAAAWCHLCLDFYVFYCISLHQFCSFYSDTPFSASTVPSANQGEFGTFPTASFTTFAPP